MKATALLPAESITSLTWKWSTGDKINRCSSCKLYSADLRIACMHKLRNRPSGNGCSTDLAYTIHYFPPYISCSTVAKCQRPYHILSQFCIQVFLMDEIIHTVKYSFYPIPTALHQRKIHKIAREAPFRKTIPTPTCTPTKPLPNEQKKGNTEKRTHAPNLTENARTPPTHFHTTAQHHLPSFPFSTSEPHSPCPYPCPHRHRRHQNPTTTIQPQRLQFPKNHLEALIRRLLKIDLTYNHSAAL